MNYKIERVECLSVGTAPMTVALGGLSFLMENGSDSAVVYFKESRDDGAAAESSNAYALGPGKETALPLAARELSLMASAADTDVRLLVLDTE